MRKRILMLIVLGVACCLTIAGCRTKSVELTYAEQYDLGVRYLSDGNYDEAIIAFTAAIEIDARTADAYLGLADAYVGAGDMAMAMATLQNGVDQTDDERLKDALMTLTVNMSLTQEQQAMLTDLWTAFQTGDPQRVTDIMDAYAYAYNGDISRLEVLAQSLSGSHRRLAFDGNAFHMSCTGIGMVVFGNGSNIYYGNLVNGIPQGHGVMFNVDTWFENGGICVCWCESGWENGAASGEARLRDYYSQSYYAGADADGMDAGLDIACTFGLDEIMTQAQVTVWAKMGGQEHQFTYQVADGKVIWDGWGIGYQDGERTLPCEVHADCGVEYEARNAGQEFYQNTRSRWNYKEIPRELQHYMNYGLNIGLSGG